MREMIQYVDRVGSNSSKWDNQERTFGENGLMGMWVADMDFQAAACVREALRRYVDFGIYGYGGYGSCGGAYQQAFIDWERTRHGCEVKPEWLRFCPGVVPGINWLVQICSNPGDGIIVLTPAYYPFFSAVTDNGRRLVTSELSCTDGRYTVDFAGFERKIVENGVKAFILCSPHNPVGRVWTRGELERMLEICRRHGVLVISDEIHQDLVFDGHTHTPVCAVGDYDDMLFMLTAPSKTFNLAGLQNAFIIIPDQGLRQRFDRFAQGVHVLGGNAAGYVAAEAAYRGGRDWLEQVLGIIRENDRVARERLTRALPKLTISPLEGTYLMWMNFGAYLTEEELKPFFQGKCRLALDYGAWFGGNAGCCVRMNLATSRENVEEAVSRIITALA